MKKLREQTLRKLVREEISKLNSNTISEVSTWNFRRKKFLKELLKLISNQLNLKDVKIHQVKNHIIFWSFRPKNGWSKYTAYILLSDEVTHFEIGTTIESEETEKEIVNSYLVYRDYDLDPKKVANLYVKKYKSVYSKLA